MKNVFGKASDSLVRFMDRYPYGSKFVLSSSLTSLADYLNQTQIMKRDWDVSRTVRMGFISGLMNSTNSVVYFQHFVPRVWSTSYFKGLKSEQQKILLTLQLDAFTFFPVATTVWQWLVEFLKEANFENSQRFVIDNWLINYKRIVCFWTLANSINYKYVPVKYRVLYVIVANFAWALAIILMNDHIIGVESDKDKEKLCVEKQ